MRKQFEHDDTELGATLARTTDLMDRVLLREMAKKNSLSPVQGGILHTIYDGREYTIEELMELTLKEGTTLTRIVNRMVSAGLISRETIPGGRKLKIRITEKGKQLFNPTAMEACFTNIFAIFSEAEKTSFHVLLVKLVKYEAKLLKENRFHPHDSIID